MSAKRRHKRNNMQLTPAIILLNALIVIVLGLLVFFIFLFITSDPNGAQQTLPDTPEPIATTTTTSDTDTTTSLSITKATTLPPPEETETPESSSQQHVNNYNMDFFKNDLFIGDSIMTGFSGFGFLPNSIVFAQIGLNPDSVFTTTIDGKTAKQKANELQPDRIYIMLGTNGLAFLSPEYMANNMKSFYKELKTQCPSSEIVVLSIPPVTRVHEQNKPEENIEKISIYNSFLQSIAEENDYEYVSIYALLSGSDGYMQDIYAENDGLHFKGAAYTAVLTELQNQFSN